MYNISDKVRILKDVYTEKRVNTRNAVGTIIYTYHSTVDGSLRYNVYISDLNEIVYNLSDDQLESVAIKPLTITEIQQLKERLALDLLALIEVYEKETSTHVADIHLTTGTFEGDSVTVRRVIGIRLEVVL